MIGKKIRVFYKPGKSNDFHWKTKEFLKAEIDSELGTKEVYIEVYSHCLHRKEAISSIKRSPKQKIRLHSKLYRAFKENQQTKQALKKLDHINWKTSPNEFLIASYVGGTDG